MKQVPEASSILRRFLVFVLTAATAMALSAYVGFEKAASFAEMAVDPDNAIKLHALVRTTGSSRIPVTILDMDDETFAAWDQPASFPRDKLFDLVDAAARGRASAIVVDVDLTSASDPAAVSTSMERLEAYAGGGGPSHKVPLLLVRRLWPANTDPGRKSPETVRIPTYGGASRGPEQTSLEDFVQTSDSMMWVSGLFRPEGDGTIRSWRLAEPMCNPPASMPIRGFLSAPLAAAALFDRRSDGSAIPLDPASMKKQADDLAGAACGPQGDRGFAKIRDAAGLGWIKSDGSVRRIPFAFWKDESDPMRFGYGEDGTGRAVPLVAIRPAARFLDHLRDREACDGDPCNEFAGRVVLIGASHFDSQDLHLTPLGPMPGVYLLANVVTGADRALKTEGFWSDSCIWAVALFILVAGIRVWIGAYAAIAGGLFLVLAFLGLTDWFDMDPAVVYGSIAGLVVMLGLAVPAGTVVGAILHVGRQACDRLRTTGAPKRQAGLPLIALAAVQGTGIGPSKVEAVEDPSRRPIGIVVRIDRNDGRSGPVLLRRADKPERTLAEGDYVYDGDGVRVPDGRSTVRISRRSGILEICPPNSRPEQCWATVSGSGGYIEQAGSFFGGVQRILSWYGATNAVNLTSRASEGPTIRFGGTKPKKILGGERRLWIRWFGGAPPYDVEVSKDKKIILRSRVVETEVNLAPVRLVPGSHSIVVKDSAGRIAELPVLVVDAAPAAPAFAAAAPTNQMELFLGAAWLSAQENGSWTFEATQRLTPMVDELHLAATLRSGLSSGASP